MSNRLEARIENKGSLLDKRGEPFIILIKDPLDKKYNFSKLSKDGLKKWQAFIDDTIGQNRTISEVDKLYLRMGSIKPNNREFADTEEGGALIIHYGKDNQRFRVFGYYNEQNYFVLFRIDEHHKVHET